MAASFPIFLTLPNTLKSTRANQSCWEFTWSQIKSTAYVITDVSKSFKWSKHLYCHDYQSQIMKLWYLSHRRPAKAQARLRRAVSPEPSLFTHMKYGHGRRVRAKLRHLTPLDGWACHLKNAFTENETYHNIMIWLIKFLNFR